MITVFGEKKFRPIKKLGIAVPKYHVSSLGEVYSEYSNKILTPAVTNGKEHNKTGGKKLNVHIVCPKSYWLDKGGWQYAEGHGSNDMLRFTVTIHRLVMDAWKPIDEFPPAVLADDWDKAPESFKQWVRDTAIIDHIDDNPENNRVENLRWCTPVENSHHRKKRDFIAEL